MRKCLVVAGLLIAALAGALTAPLSAGGGQTPPHTEECQEQLEACLSQLCVVFPGDGQTGAELLYEDHDDGTFTDLNTGLMWQVKKNDVVGGPYCWELPTPDYCLDVRELNPHSWSDSGTAADGTVFTLFFPTLNHTCGGEGGGWDCDDDEDCVDAPIGYCGFAGFTDWRLPNVKELMSLIEFLPPDFGSFPSAEEGGVFWSSTEYDIYAWAVRFTSAEVIYWPKFGEGGASVRAVRGGW